MIQQTAALFEFHEKIQVAVRRGLTAGDGANHANVARTVASRDLQDV